MKNVVYCVLMSALIGVVVGAIVVNVANILVPDLDLDYGLPIALFTLLTWGVLSLVGKLRRRA